MGQDDSKSDHNRIGYKKNCFFILYFLEYHGPFHVSLIEVQKSYQSYGYESISISSLSYYKQQQQQKFKKNQENLITGKQHWAFASDRRLGVVETGDLENVCLSPQSALIFAFPKIHPRVYKSYHFLKNLEIELFLRALLIFKCWKLIHMKKILCYTP